MKTHLKMRSVTLLISDVCSHSDSMSYHNLRRSLLKKATSSSGVESLSLWWWVCGHRALLITFATVACNCCPRSTNLIYSSIRASCPASCMSMFSPFTPFTVVKNSGIHRPNPHATNGADASTYWKPASNSKQWTKIQYWGSALPSWSLPVLPHTMDQNEFHKWVQMDTILCTIKTIATAWEALHKQTLSTRYPSTRCWVLAGSCHWKSERDGEESEKERLKCDRGSIEALECTLAISRRKRDTVPPTDRDYMPQCLSEQSKATTSCPCYASIKDVPLPS